MQISQNRSTPLSSSIKSERLTYTERAVYTDHPLAKQLLRLMDKKKTNLAFSADVTDKNQLIDLIHAVGAEICMLKLHIDIIDDVDDLFIELLKELAAQYQFVLFEDRKFADIGTTVVKQYAGGTFSIVDWAHIINAHVVAGPGTIEGLRSVGLPHKRGLLVLAQMSSKGMLMDEKYTQQAVTWAEKYADFAMGFICQEKLSNLPGMIHCTPGVQLSKGDGDLGQQYNMPEYVIGKKLSDVIIVGSGIYKSSDPAQAAYQYRHAAFSAYRERVNFRD